MITIPEKEINRVVSEYQLYYKVVKTPIEYRVDYMSYTMGESVLHKFYYQEHPPKEKITENFLYVIHRIMEIEKSNKN